MSYTPRTDDLAVMLSKSIGYGHQKITPEEGQAMLWKHARQLEIELRLCSAAHMRSIPQLRSDE